MGLDCKSSQLGAILLPWGYLVMSRDIFCYLNWVGGVRELMLLASSEQKPGKLLTILQYMSQSLSPPHPTTDPPYKKTHPIQNVKSARLANPGLE